MLRETGSETLRGLMGNESTGGTRSAILMGGMVLLLVLAAVILLRLGRLEKLAVAPPGGQTSAPEIKEFEPPPGTRWTQVYVPAYDRVLFDGGRALPVDVRLQVRNRRPEGEIYVRSIEVFGTDGEKIRSLVDAPFRIIAFASADFVVQAGAAPTSDGDEDEKKKSPAEVSHIVVEWGAREAGLDPLIEATMVDERAQLIQTTRGTFLGRGTSPQSHADRPLPPPPSYPQPPISEGVAPASATKPQPKIELVSPRPSGGLQPKGQ